MLWWDSCDTVHCGFWVNYSNDSIRGSTLTLPIQWGVILVAFFALFLKTSGAHLWGAICFTIHQINASPKSQDDLYHQIQLILRNTESEETFIESLLKVGWAHKGSRFEAYRRCLFLVLLAIIYGLGYNALSTLSSQIIAARDGSVLSKSKSCGWMKETDLTDLESLASDKTFEATNALVVMARNGYLRSAGYSRSCYGRYGGNTTACEIYVQTTIPYSTTWDVPCPFDKKICNGSAITFDTGNIRSDVDIGLNAKPEDSLSARKILSCAPIAGERYTDGWKTMPEDVTSRYGIPKGTLWKGYQFGQNSEIDAPLNGTNYTAFADEIHWKFGDQYYNLGWLNSFVNLPTARAWQARPFQPIPDLQTNDSDVVLIALTNRVSYRSVIEDPWFTASNCTADPTMPIPNACHAENVFSFLACTEQYQFCTSAKQCSPLTGLYPLSPSPSDQNPNSDASQNHSQTPRNSSFITGFNPTQHAIYTLLWKMLWGAQLNFQLGFIGRENLIANEYLWDGGFGFRISSALPSTHWQTEVQNWMNTTLSALQRGAATFARPTEFDVGPGISSLQHIVAPEDEYLRKLCDSIRVRSEKHMSFSVPAIALTLGIGFFCIFSYHLFRKLTLIIQRRTGRGVHRRLEWIESSAFQLQRMAAEGRGIGPWEGREDDVPRLVEYAHLFNLTAQSLKGRWSRVESYEIVTDQGRDGEEEIAVRGGDGDGVEIELGTVMGTKGNVRVEEGGVEDDRARLLDD